MSWMCCMLAVYDFPNIWANIQVLVAIYTLYACHRHCSSNCNKSNICQQMYACINFNHVSVVFSQGIFGTHTHTHTLSHIYLSLIKLFTNHNFMFVTNIIIFVKWQRKKKTNTRINIYTVGPMSVQILLLVWGCLHVIFDVENILPKC